MPRDRALRPVRSAPSPTLDPVEMAKRILDTVDTKYTGVYLPIDDSYVITITQKQPVDLAIAQRLRALNFSTTGGKKFFFKRYSTARIAAEENEINPIYDNLGSTEDHLRYAPDPFSDMY